MHLTDADTWEAFIANVRAAYSLPQIAGGQATWCLASRRPIAVFAQQWSKPRMVSWNMHDVLTTTTVDGIMHVHFTYFAQIDPEITFEILRRLRLP
ncbi:MAG: hypothetical protein ACRELY_14620 [Polyangiaceae bacterium]